VGGVRRQCVRGKEGVVCVLGLKGDGGAFYK
jgi:hypothetical protein